MTRSVKKFLLLKMSRIFKPCWSIICSKPALRLWFENGEDGLWLAIEHNPDLILLDWMLPLLSGIEVLRQLRNRSDTREIQVMMLTARGEEGDSLRGLDGGADDYVTKPFSPAELTGRTDKAIIRRQTRGYDAKLTGGGIELDLEQKRVLRPPLFI